MSLVKYRLVNLPTRERRSSHPAAEVVVIDLASLGAGAEQVRGTFLEAPRSV